MEWFEQRWEVTNCSPNKLISIFPSNSIIIIIIIIIQTIRSKIIKSKRNQTRNLKTIFVDQSRKNCRWFQFFHTSRETPESYQRTARRGGAIFGVPFPPSPFLQAGSGPVIPEACVSYLSSLIKDASSQPQQRPICQCPIRVLSWPRIFRIGSPSFFLFLPFFPRWLDALPPPPFFFTPRCHRWHYRRCPFPISFSVALQNVLQLYLLRYSCS